MKNNIEYEIPEIEIILLNQSDVITSSAFDGEDDEDWLG